MPRHSLSFVSGSPRLGHIGHKGDDEEAVCCWFPFRWQQGLASSLMDDLAGAIMKSRNARAKKYWEWSVHSLAAQVRALRSNSSAMSSDLKLDLPFLPAFGQCPYRPTLTLLSHHSFCNSCGPSEYQLLRQVLCLLLLNISLAPSMALSRLVG